MLSYFLLASLEWVLNCPLQDPFVLATENTSVTLPEAHGTFRSLQRTRREYMAGQDLVCWPCSILRPAMVAILPASNMSSMLPPWDFISVGTSLSLTPSLDTNHVLECRMKDLWGSLVCLGLGSRPLGRETSWLSQPLPLGGAQCVISGTYKRGNLAAFRPERPPACSTILGGPRGVSALAHDYLLDWEYFFNRPWRPRRYCHLSPNFWSLTCTFPFWSAWDTLWEWAMKCKVYDSGDSTSELNALIFLLKTGIV